MGREGGGKAGKGCGGGKISWGLWPRKDGRGHEGPIPFPLLLSLPLSVPFRLLLPLSFLLTHSAPTKAELGIGAERTGGYVRGPRTHGLGWSRIAARRVGEGGGGLLVGRSGWACLSWAPTVGGYHSAYDCQRSLLFRVDSDALEPTGVNVYTMPWDWGNTGRCGPRAPRPQWTHRLTHAHARCSKLRKKRCVKVSQFGNARDGVQSSGLAALIHSVGALCRRHSGERRRRPPSKASLTASL